MKYLIDKNGKLHSIIAIENYEFNEAEFNLIETNLIPEFLVNQWDGSKWIDISTDEDRKPEIPQSISPAEFTYGLILQNVTDAEVLDFIDNHISDAEMQIKARILFTKATEFEYGNPVLNAFVGGFNQYLNAIGKTELIYNNIFINGITLNQQL